MSIHWYPGHMRKASNEMIESLPLVNLVIEVLDARIPFSSSNPFIQDLVTEKPSIKILNKCDLADPEITKVWQEYYEQQDNTKTLALDLQHFDPSKQVIDLINTLCPQKEGRNTLVMVTGIPNVGKSSLIKKVLHPVLAKRIGGHTSEQSGAFQALEGHINRIDAVEFVDQNPIGRSSRSNPVTFIKAFDDIRTLFANQPLAKMRGFKPAHFSFNVDGGRCETCQGEGQTTVEMQFMPDIHLTCESCEGKRFKEEVLEVKYHERSINDILELSVDEAIAFFEMHARTSPEKKVIQKLMPLQEVGLGYVTLGQSSSTLSGGEAQRIKLASFIGKGQSADGGGTFFLFDEPTTGLHVHDIRKLVASFNKMLELGHTILVIEHNLEVIKQADWLIDLGPEGGDRGGQVVFEGTPEQMAESTAGYTGKYLKGKL